MRDVNNRTPTRRSNRYIIIRQQFVVCHGAAPMSAESNNNNRKREIFKINESVPIDVERTEVIALVCHARVQPLQQNGLPQCIIYLISMCLLSAAKILQTK